MPVDEEIINIKMMFALEGFANTINRLNSINTAIKRLGSGSFGGFLGAGPGAPNWSAIGGPLGGGPAGAAILRAMRNSQGRLPGGPYPMLGPGITQAYGRMQQGGGAYSGAWGQAGNPFNMPPIQRSQALMVIPNAPIGGGPQMAQVQAVAAHMADQIQYTISGAFMGTIPKAFVDELKQLPGISMDTMKSFSAIGGAIEEMKISGKLTGEEFQKITKTLDSLQTRYKSINIDVMGTMNKGAQTFQQRMEGINKTFTKLKMSNFMLQMGTLGVMFSFMSVIAMITSAITSLTSQVQDIGGMFKNVAMGMAFIKDPKIKAGMRDLLGNPKAMIDAWKNYTGVMATFNAMMMKLAVTIFTDDVIMAKLYQVITVIMDKLANPTFINNLLTLIEKLVMSLPGLVDDVTNLLSILSGVSKIPGFENLVKTFGELFLISVILLPVLSAIGWALAIIEGLSAALASTKIAEWFATATTAVTGLSAAFDALMLALGLTTVDAITGAVSLTLAGLFVSIIVGIGVGLAAVWLMVQTGFTKWVAGLGMEFRKLFPTIMDALTVLTTPFGLLGTLIIDLVTLKFQNIGTDLANVIIQAIQSALRLVRNVVIRIPIYGSGLASTIDQALSNLQTYNTATTTGTKIPQAADGGYVAGSGLAIIHKGETIIPATEGKEFQINFYNTIGSIVGISGLDEFNASQARQVNYQLINPNGG